jgi:thiol-disulfide isomerase/thioredoxin
VGKWIKLTLCCTVVLLAVAVGVELVRGAAATLDSGPRERPDFTAKDLQGREWSLADHRGKEPVIIAFFATWCGPCQQELPYILQMKKRYADRGVQVVLISAESGNILRQAGMSELDAVVIPNGDKIYKAYGVDPIPHMFFFDETGRVRLESEGLDLDLLDQVRKHLEKLPPRVARAALRRLI